MKYIEKKTTNEPATLKQYREETPNPTFKGFGDQEQLLKIALLDEQGHLCAYCMKRISLKRSHLGRGEKTAKPMIEVEHYLTQENHKDKALLYSNMVGVCNGYTQGDIHCDKSKKEEFKILNPHHSNVESLVTYSLDGSILATKDDTDIFYDLNHILNLNCHNLKIARQSAIDIARDILLKKHPVKQWTKALIQKEIDEWKSKNEKGKYRQFCQVAIWFWEEQRKRNRYPAK